MGAAVSTSLLSSSQQAVSTSTNNTLSSFGANCALATQASQNIKAGDIKDSNGVTIENAATIVGQLYCIQSGAVSSDVNNQLSSNLASDLQAGASAGVGLGISVSTSDINTLTSSIQNVANNFSQSTFQSCVGNSEIAQGITVGNVLNSSNITVDNTAVINIVANCTQKQQAFVAAQNNLAATLSTVAKATTSSGTNLGYIILLIVVVLLVFGLLASGVIKFPGKIINGGNKDNNESDKTHAI